MDYNLTSADIVYFCIIMMVLCAALFVFYSHRMFLFKKLAKKYSLNYYSTHKNPYKNINNVLIRRAVGGIINGLKIDVLDIMDGRDFMVKFGGVKENKKKSLLRFIFDAKQDARENFTVFRVNGLIKELSWDMIPGSLKPVGYQKYFIPCFVIDRILGELVAQGTSKTLMELPTKGLNSDDSVFGDMFD